MFEPLSESVPDAQPQTAVLQPLPGIGDMIWHLPVLRALAHDDPSGKIDLIAHEKLPVKALLGNESYLNWVMPLAMGRDWAARLRALSDIARSLKSRGYRRVVILHHSWRYALAAKLAGVAEIYGYGLGWQNRLLTQSKFLRPSEKKLFPLYRARRLLDILRIPHFQDAPQLTPNPLAAASLAKGYADSPKPWIGFGIGSTEPNRVWPAERFAAIADLLWAEGYRSIFLLGARHENALAQDIVSRCRAARPVIVTDRPIDQVTSLLAACSFAICTDSGLMNIAAAVGVPVYVLFGTVQPYDFSPWLRPVTPESGIDPVAGAARISADRLAAALRRDGILKD